MRRGKAKGERKKQRAREASKKCQQDNSSYTVLRQASVWCTCRCEQCRQQGSGRSPTTPGSKPATDYLGALQTSTGVEGCPARGCTAKLGAGDGRDTHARISGRFRFTDDFLVSETILPLPSPRMICWVPLSVFSCKTTPDKHLLFVSFLAFWLILL